MSGPYRPFIDWLKCVGIVLIVCGHVAARPINALTPPVYPKQLGVAFFLFALGYTLASDRRPRLDVVFNRLFDVYLYGVPMAILFTIVTVIAAGAFAPSNYLPFFLGANVAFNNFPANPTTWYIGTYIHIVLLWAVVFHRMIVRPWMLVASCIAEVLIRAWLWNAAGGFVAYMSLTNWATVFLLGIYVAQEPDRLRSRVPPAGWALLLAVFAFAAHALVDPRIAERSFPFMRLSLTGSAAAIVASAIVSATYVAWTFFMFRLTSTRLAPALVELTARNTIVVFIAHMPVFFALDPWLVRLGMGYWSRASIDVLACLPGLILVSESIRQFLQPQALRDASRARMRLVLGRLWPAVEARSNRMETGV